MKQVQIEAFVLNAIIEITDVAHDLVARLRGGAALSPRLSAEEARQKDDEIEAKKARLLAVIQAWVFYRTRALISERLLQPVARELQYFDSAILTILAGEVEGWEPVKLPPIDPNVSAWSWKCIACGEEIEVSVRARAKPGETVASAAEALVRIAGWTIHAPHGARSSASPFDALPVVVRCDGCQRAHARSA